MTSDQHPAAEPGRYERPLDAEALAESQAAERARLCDRLETVWNGLQQDIEGQREFSERGVDPRLQQLQLQTIKLQAQLLRLTTAPMPAPPPEEDPEAAAETARNEALRNLERLSSRLGE